MTSYTPTQGFTYQTSGDRPCDLQPTIAALASEADVKGAQYDTDLLGVQKPTMVKVSVTNPTISALSGSINYFDTLEYNNGTPTDLSANPGGVQLGPGFYLIGAYVVFSPIPPASTVTMNTFLGSATLGTGTLENFAYGQLSTSIASNSAGSDPLYTQPNQSFTSTAYVRIPASPTLVAYTGFNNSQSIPLLMSTYYASLWAVQIGSL